MVASFLFQWVKDNIKREEGQAMAEYGIILALIAAVCITLLVLLGNADRERAREGHERAVAQTSDGGPAPRRPTITVFA